MRYVEILMVMTASRITEGGAGFSAAMPSRWKCLW